MATETAPDTYDCAVCAEPVSAPMSAECNWCGQRFHLNQRNDVEAKDCGQVWIDEQYLALQFACDNCLRGTDRERPEASRQTAAPRARRYKRRA